MLSIEQINLLQAQNEGIKKQNKDLQKEINKLQEENERLKAEVETWEYQTQKSDEMSDEDYRNAKRYKTCLQEIKEIAERIAKSKIDRYPYGGDEATWEANLAKQILQLIDKAEV